MLHQLPYQQEHNLYFYLHRSESGHTSKYVKGLFNIYMIAWLKLMARPILSDVKISSLTTRIPPMRQDLWEIRQSKRGWIIPCVILTRTWQNPRASSLPNKTLSFTLLVTGFTGFYKGRVQCWENGDGCSVYCCILSLVAVVKGPQANMSQTAHKKISIKKTVDTTSHNI